LRERSSVPAIERVVSTLAVGQHKKHCPMCRDSRTKNKHDRSLSIKVDAKGVQYQCHHCDINGGWVNDREWSLETVPVFREPISDVPQSDNESARKYLQGRRIADSVIQSHTITGTRRFNGKTVPAVGFPYRDGDLVNAIKWRSADTDKRFSQDNVCEDFFNIDFYVDGNDLLICEGEIDALAWMSSDLPDNVSVVSIPNGAPSKVRDGKITPEDDKKFAYIWKAKRELESASRIILNTDNDGPGNALKEEIIRRIGSAKVWLVDLGDHKDAADALEGEGPAYLLGQFEDCQPVPTIGLHGAEVFSDAVVDLYDNGQLRGARTGLSSLDKFIQIPPGMVTVVTGFPSSGKSDFVDQICLNLALSMNYKTVFCSFEKPPELHLMQLAQKLTKRPFFKGSGQRMSPEERDHAQAWLKEHFLFMDSRRDSPNDITGILATASAAVMRMGCRVLVIDPYNYITLSNSTKETDEISNLLTQVQRWAKSHDAHVFFIAHPTKIHPDRRGSKVIVSGHDIAGSAAWFAKADIGITIWRDPHDVEPPEAHIWKVRWSWIGRHGVCPLKFDRSAGFWSDFAPTVDENEEDWDF
jgi:twinkle protein